MQLKFRDLLIFICFLSLILLLNPIDIARSDEVEFSLSAPVSFEFKEDSITQGFFNDSNSIDVPLPSSSWNLKDLEINFTDIEFEPESVVIEGDFSYGTFKRVYNKNPAKNLFGLAVQLKIDSPVYLYGLEIYGYNNLSHPGVPQIQIRGFNSLDNKPSTDIFASTNLNMNATPGWQFQNFSTPIFLATGNYSLVLDGTSIPAYAVNDAGFYWAYNSVDPNEADLHVSEYDSDWSIGTLGEPFLYKLNLKYNTSIYPEDINMTAHLDGNSYQVLNGNARGKGYLKRQDVNYNGSQNKIQIAVKNNKTEKLKFDTIYNFKIFNEFKAQGVVHSQVNGSNEWNITPTFIKVSDEQKIHFNYPRSWINPKLYKNSVEITSDVLIYTSNHTITIPNKLIENGTNWAISAFSPQFSFLINAPKTEFDFGQELRFSLSTELSGNYTFVLIDPIGLEKYREVKTIPLDSNLFTYEIPSNSIEGIYNAIILWNNGTDAGINYQSFQFLEGILPNPNPDFSFLYTLGFIIAGVVIAGGFGYVTFKKVESRRREKLNLILEQCNDIMNIRHIIVLDIKTGIDLYSKSFDKKELEPTLISGFLHAIHNFGVEVIAGEKNSKTVKVEYKDSIIIMTEFINLRLIVIMKENPSQNFYYAIESLAYHIYKYYGKLIDSFKGNLKPFRSMGKLVESDLNISLLYPLTISLHKDIKLSQDEREMVKKAKKFMKEANYPYFYFLYLMPENACKPKDYQVTLQLIKKGIFQPIDKQEYVN